MRRITLSIFLYLLLILILSLLMIWAMSLQYYFTAIFFLITTIIFFFIIFGIIRKLLVNTEHTLLAISKGDYSVKLQPNKLTPEMYSSLSKILEKEKKLSQKHESIRIIYENIIDSVDTGVLILKEEEGEIQIFYSNESFSSLLEIPRFTKWYLLEKRLQTFNKYLKVENWRDVRDVITISLNGKEQVFSLRTFTTIVYDSKYLIVNLDTLQSIIDRKEKESWYNLMKVMSHEILNTITPINSLSDNLAYVIEDKSEEFGDEFKDVQTSISIIKKRTQHLIDFVETYRSLAELPTPNKERIKIKEILEGSVTVLSAMIDEKNINLEIKVEPDNLTMNLDKKQTEQAVINLLTNSIYAVEEVSNPKILLSAYHIEDKFFIQVKDNGKGISPSIKREIFIPFFTTRSNGAGIGLSLTKNIVQGHGGHISFFEEDGWTCFLMQF